MQREQHWNSTIEGDGTSVIYVHTKEYIEENENKIPQRIVRRRLGRVVRGRVVLDPSQGFHQTIDSLNNQPERKN